MVLPQPVSPEMTTSWCSLTVAMMLSRSDQAGSFRRDVCRAGREGRRGGGREGGKICEQVAAWKGGRRSLPPLPPSLPPFLPSSLPASARTPLDPAWPGGVAASPPPSGAGPRVPRSRLQPARRLTTGMEGGNEGGGEAGKEESGVRLLARDSISFVSP